MMDIDELKKKYNLILKRIRKAEVYFQTCEEEDIDKYLPNLIELFNNLKITAKQIKSEKYEMTEHEILKGFEN